MLTFKTETGSIYKVDTENKKICRMYGVKDPTERQGQDGEWKDYYAISSIEVGRSVVICWELVGMVVGKTTMTSLVVEVTEDIPEN